MVDPDPPNGSNIVSRFLAAIFDGPRHQLDRLHCRVQQIRLRPIHEPDVALVARSAQ
jgi:hypothetical protein